ncbi:MAG: hypothetical protein ABMA14_28660 [Hyphomonadaceae bacterium]
MAKRIERAFVRAGIFSPEGVKLSVRLGGVELVVGCIALVQALGLSGVMNDHVAGFLVHHQVDARQAKKSRLAKGHGGEHLAQHVYALAHLPSRITNAIPLFCRADRIS